MIGLIRGNDCAPIAAGDRASLSWSHLARLEPAQQVLLRPLDYPDLDSWRKAAIAAVATALGGDAGAFELHIRGEAPEEGIGLPQDHFGEWTEYLPSFPRGFDLHREALRQRVATRSTSWGEHLSWFYDTPYFNEFLRSVGGLDPLSLVTPGPGPVGNANIRIHHSSPRGARFGVEELEMARLLHPAFEAGVQTVLRTAAAREALSTAVDAQPSGALIYDLQGRLLHRNPAVAATAPTRRVEKAVLESGRMMARALAADDPLDWLSPRAVRRSVRLAGMAVDLSAVRLAEGSFTFQPAVLITLAPGEAALPGRHSLRERYGLTRRQSEVALLLAQRRTDREIAEVLCISPHTARGHTEAVMGKLGVHDRREIERLLRRAEGAPQGNRSSASSEVGSVEIL